MNLPGIYWRARRRGLQTWNRTVHAARPFYRCPMCSYDGPFDDWTLVTFRPSAVCPACASQERHRLQWVVMNAIPERRRFSAMSVLHCAPEGMMRALLSGVFGTYTSGDLDPARGDVIVDLRKMQFADASFDVVFASHVLEHISEDGMALAEIRRVLRPGGFAVLPVPVVGEHTVEYGAPREEEWGHVRSPGRDYFDRMREYFGRLVVYEAAQFEERFCTSDETVPVLYR